MALEEDILKSMDEAADNAFEALSMYKFFMFGYHAARWVNYNRLLPNGKKKHNPFTELIEIAKLRQVQKKSLQRAEEENP